MDPPTETRALELRDMVLSDLESLQVLDGPERDAVLLRAQYAVGELYAIVAGANSAPDHEGSEAILIRRWLIRISWELVKVLSDTDFYPPHPTSRESLAFLRPVHIGRGLEADPPRIRTIAA